ncbi:MAG: gamma-glutamyltransferase [Salinarimonadaceae bacterium]|nr:MAG: gamma-glutamyltransferase [Salinarimonadaceae bacterium]
MHDIDHFGETQTFSTAAVAAPSELAAQSGRRVLIEGGNAIEATIAMAATIGVVFPHMNALGGDGFWLIRAPKGALHGIDAAGFAGAKATQRLYREAECETIPARGPLAALTVAGAVAGWEAARQVSLSIGGRLPLRLLLEDAIRHAREGYAVAASEERYWEREKGGATLAALTAVPGFMEAFAIDGEPPRAGDIRKAPRLADTLDHLANAGLADFHRGDVAREIAVDLERLGSPVTRDDLKRFEARRAQPLSVRIGDFSAHNLPPPTQGIASLMILGIFERLGVAGAESLAMHHGLIEAVKRAFAIRDRVVTDPDRVNVDLDTLLTPEALSREASAIARDRAAPFPLKSDHGDTVWMGAIDTQGFAVSYIQSIYWDYGSGLVLPGTGVHWQNRGMAFSLDPLSRNPLEPGRKPFHTLNPAIAAFDDGRVAPYGCMGGDGQPQTQAQIITRYRAGMSPAAAVGAPRWLLGRTWGETSTTLKLEDRFDPDIERGLRRFGHEVEELDRARRDTFGHAGMLVRFPRDGRIEAAHDPRADGGVSLGAFGI